LDIALNKASSNKVYVRPAKVLDLPQLSQLFDAYRQFYEQTADIGLATQFISTRLNQQDSVIFVAVDANEMLVGFCQLYPSFCSVMATRIAVLYDLFVDTSSRKTGAGKSLMLVAKAYAEEKGFARLDLTTAKTNLNAQKLYESLGWAKDEIFLTYTLIIAAKTQI
jgi:ribosomal protein S18 acetylase RimI-like enzyme